MRGRGIEVFVFSEKTFIGSRCFTKGAITIGSGLDTDLRLKGPQVHPLHLVLTCLGDSVVVEPRARSVYVNGATAKAACRVSSFDRIQVGSFELKVNRLDARAPAPAPVSDDAPTVVRSLPVLDNEEEQQEPGSEEDTVPRIPRPSFSAQERPEERVEDEEAVESDTVKGEGQDQDQDQDQEGDNEEDEEFVEPFSLLENVVSERFKSPVETEPHASVEVIHYRGKEIVDLLRADPGKSIHVNPDAFRLLSVDGHGGARLFFRRSHRGTLVRRGRPRPLQGHCEERYRLGEGRDLFGVTLARGDFAQVVTGSGSGYLVRFVHPPALPRARRRLRINGQNLQAVAASAALHLLVLLLVGFAAPGPDLTVATSSDQEIFRDVALRDLKLDRSERERAKKEPEVVTDVKPKPHKTRRPPKPGPWTGRRPSKVSHSTKTQKTQKDLAKVISALENIRPSGSGPIRSDLKALSSNIAAVRVPGGTASSFKLAGVIGKVPGGGVRLAGGVGSGVGRDTRTGSQILTGTTVGTITIRDGWPPRVRAKVVKPPKRDIDCTGGVLDRGAIQRVVNRHMQAIQRCYEVQLLKNPNLAGKIIFDWTIAPTGHVSIARQVTSSVRSPAVSSCILTLIRSWRFRRPTGGSVQVRYPFVFRARSF